MKAAKTYSDARKAINSMTAIQVIESQIKEYENPENWNQQDRFILGKIAGLKQALRLLQK
jgi:hypothetical protein